MMKESGILQEVRLWWFYLDWTCSQSEVAWNILTYGVELTWCTGP